MSQKRLSEAFDALNELDKLFDERIVENNSMRADLPIKQCTHAYIYYRSLIWKAKDIIRDLIK